jgi:hypothetical protein
MRLIYTFCFILTVNFFTHGQCWKSLESEFDTLATRYAIQSNGSLWQLTSNSLPTQLGFDRSWKKCYSSSNLCTFLIAEDSTMWGFGNNGNGELGIGNTNYQPTLIQLNNERWLDMSEHDRQTIAVRSDGTLWYWGFWCSPCYSTLLPTQIGTDNNWTEVHLNGSTIIALKSDGTIWNGNYNGSFTFTQIGTDNDWNYIWTNLGSWIGIKNDGTLWQNNNQVGTDTDWKKVIGDSPYIGIKNNGSLWYWGDGLFGSLPVQLNQNVSFKDISGIYYASAWDDYIYGITSSGELYRGSAILNSPSDLSNDTLANSLLTTLNVNSQTICYGEFATLTAIPSILGGNFLWSPGGDTTESITVNPSSSTTYTISYTSGDCQSTEIATVIVNPNPVVFAGSDINVCLGDSVILSASGGQTYDWDTGENSSSIQVSPDTTTTYVVEATNIYGCTGTDQVTVNIIPNPTVTVGSITICQGSSGTLIAQPSITGGTYVWTQLPSNNVIQDTDFSINVNPFSNAIYSVGYSVGNCVSASVMATVTVLPVSSLTVNSVTICSGDFATLTATANLNGGTYLWSTGETTSMISTNPLITSDFIVTYTIGGCEVIDTATIIVNPNPVISAGTDISMCPGDSVLLSATGAQSYNWNNGSFGNEIFVSPINTASYVVYGVDSLGCTATDTLIVNPVQFIPPTVTTFSSDPGSCNGTGLVTLDPTGNFSVYWGNGVEGENGYDLCPGLTVVYVVENNFGCQYSAYGFVEETGNSYPLSIQLNVQDVSFDGNCDGSAQFFGFGGVPPYSFELVSASNSIVTNQEWADMLCSGNYNVRIMDAMGNIDSLPFYVADPINVITFNPYPDSIIIDTLHTEIYEDCNIDFVTLDSAWVTQINYINADTAIITWAIQDMNGIQYIDQSYNVTNLQGSFTVELTVFCPGKALGDPYMKVFTTIYINNDFNVSINELSDNDLISLYPNPSSDFVQIKSQNKIDRIQLFDSFGRDIALSNQISENEYKIRLPKENGMYILKIICENGKSYSKRIVKTSKY